MAESRTDRSKRDRLYDLAAEHGGHFSVREAAQAGLSTRNLSHYHTQGHITSAFRGVYRLTNFPPGDHEELTVVWLATDQEAVFSHDTALQLHGLSDVLPNLIHISLPPTWRRRLLPASVERHYIEAPITQHSWVGDIPVTTPSRTLADCNAAHLSPDLLLQAIHQAHARGLIHADEANALAGNYGTKVL